MVPCPAALIVLLSAAALHRVGFGLFLIVAFSVGLAAVLIAMGLTAVYAGRLMSRLPVDGPLVQRWLPITSAAMITLLGFAVAIRGLMTAGIVQIRI
jgi:ABC-type nickel/cobalt efflux system permease component RcnA